MKAAAFKFMEKKGFSTKTVNKYVIDEEHHPVILFPANMFNAIPKPKPKLK